jgi:hypothetical protein
MRNHNEKVDLQGVQLVSKRPCDRFALGTLLNAGLSLLESFANGAQATRGRRRNPQFPDNSNALIVSFAQEILKHNRHIYTALAKLR